MANTDYSKGRYLVKNPAGQLISRIDNDEYVRSGGSLLYRVDGSEFYSMHGNLLGFIDAGIVRDASGESLFCIQPE